MVHAYLEDRAKDFEDIFTLTGGSGIGARAQVGPFQTPSLLYHTDEYGWRYGMVHAPEPGSGSDASACIFGMYGKNRNGETRGKVFETAGGATPASFGHEPHIPIVSSIPGSKLPLLPFMSTIFDQPEQRGPLFYPFYTQIEIISGFIFTARIGANSGEMLDFILGFGTIDIFDDDIVSDPSP